MRRSCWMVCTLGAAMFASGCARDVKIDQAALGQLPLDQKQTMFAAEHNVSVAQTNAAAARRATDEAILFRDLAKREFAVAKGRSEVADKALEFGKTQSQPTMREAERTHDVAQKEVIAARARLDYADRLVDLRKREADLASARVDAERAEMTYVQAESLRRNSIDPGVDIMALRNSRSEMRNRVLDREREVSAIRDDVNNLRATWEDRRRTFNVAQRESPTAPNIQPPKRPDNVAPAPLPEMKRDPANQIMEPNDL